jgi:allantoinase
VSTSFALRSQRVVTPAMVGPAMVVVRQGVIAAVAPPEEAPSDLPLVDVGERVVLPGLVDPHVHVNEPGRTEWEGFDTATRAAVAGGITTLVDMPLNSVPATTTVAALFAKRRAAAGRSWVDVGFWGGVVPDNASSLPALWAAGALGFKAFLVPSGVPEFPAVDEALLRHAMDQLAGLGAPLLVHAELPGPLAGPTALLEGSDPAVRRTYAAYLASRPPAAEVQAIDLALRLARQTGARLHVVHLSTAEALGLLEEARAAGLPVTVETCPHYLTFAAPEVPDGATEWKCAPPIRGPADREGLWQALGRGTLDLVASDHSPSPPSGKCLESGDFARAWGGISSLQLALPAVWTGARERGFGLPHLVRWMAAAPARLAGLDHRKGALAVGHDADLVVFDPEASFVVDPAQLYHRHPLTPYRGRRLLGRVETTYLRGIPVFDRGRFAAEPPGALLGH